MLQNACRLLRISSSLIEVSHQNSTVIRIKRFMCVGIEKKLEPQDVFGSGVQGCFDEELNEKEGIPLNLLASVREMKSLLDKHDVGNFSFSFTCSRIGVRKSHNFFLV